MAIKASYDTLFNDDLTVNQAGAEVVRLIFQRYLVGDSFGKKAVLNYSRFLGRTTNSAGQLVVIEDEAKVVRLIYSLYLTSIGYWKI